MNAVFIGYDKWRRPLFQYGNQILVDVGGNVLYTTVKESGEPFYPTELPVPEIPPHSEVSDGTLS